MMNNGMLRAFSRGGFAFDPANDLGSLEGKVVLVTGGNIGLGAESIRQMAQHQPKQIFLAARSEKKARATIAEVKKQTPDALITFLELDLASFESIQKAVESFQTQSERLDILMNNAGIMACPPGLTASGYEIQFGTNHIGHALLTKLLFPTLKKTSAELGSDVRIVNLSSAGFNLSPSNGLLLDECTTAMEKHNTWRRYGQSKLANVLFTREIARRYPDIRCIAIHPGAVDTNLGKEMIEAHPWIKHVEKYIKALVTVPVEKGALNQLWAVTSNDAQSGKIYFPIGKENQGNSHTKNDKLAKELWDWTEKEFERNGFGGEWA